MNNRRKLMLALGASALAAPLASFAQQQGKPVRVAILSPTTEAKTQTSKQFVDAMRGLGWIEGRNIAYDRVYADDNASRLPALAAALVARGPDLIHSTSNPVILAVFARTRSIPIVFSASNDPVGSGLVQSHAHPGGNVTGVANIGFELGGKRLQLLKQALPKVTRVAVMVNPLLPENPRELKLIEDAAKTLGITVIPVIVKEQAEFDAGFTILAKQRIDALLTTHISMFLDNRKRILGFAAARKIPAVGHRGQLADDGALLSYSSILIDQVNRSAQMADKILKGAKPADIPVEQPTKFELAVNMKTAKTLGLKIPASFLVQATRLIE